MDGNGRWATQRGQPRAIGHVAGARAVAPITEAAARHGVQSLTLYAFSTDNWRRPSAETTTLMRLFGSYLSAETARCVATGTKLRVIGRRDRLPWPLVDRIREAEAATAAGTGLSLRIAIDYSSRDAIVRAASGEEVSPTRESFAARLGALDHAGVVPDVDLLIRTGGERRLSDFLLWECAYAELYFTPLLWPDFGPDDLTTALSDFADRERRFGALPQRAVG